MTHTNLIGALLVATVLGGGMAYAYTPPGVTPTPTPSMTPTPTPSYTCASNPTTQSECAQEGVDIPFNCDPTTGECTMCYIIGTAPNGQVCYGTTPISAPARLVCQCKCKTSTGAYLATTANSGDPAWDFDITDAATCGGKNGQNCSGYVQNTDSNSGGNLVSCQLVNKAQ